MRILVVGAGGVGGAIATASARREFFEHCTVADIDGGRATAVAEGTGDRQIGRAHV